MGPRSEIIKGSKVVLLLWVSMLVAAVCGFITQLVAARYLGPNHFGALSAALAAVGVVSPVVGFGVGQYWLRVFGLEGHRAERWIGASLRLVFMTTLIGVAVLTVWAISVGISPETRQVTLLLLPVVAAQGMFELLQARLQMEERYDVLAGWQSAPYILRLVVVGCVTIVGGGLLVIATGYAIAALLIGAVGVAAMWGMNRGRWRLAGHGEPQIDRTPAVEPTVRHVLRESLPFALGSIFYLVYYQSDIVLVSWMSGDRAAGVYQVAFVIVSAVYLLPSVTYQKYLLPKLHRWAEHNRERFLAVYRYGCGLMSALGLVAALGVLVVAPPLVTVLFGEAYSGAAVALRVLSVGVAAHYVATAVGGVLVTGPHMRMKVRYQGLTAVLNIGLNLVMIPKMGYIGAATSTCICEVCLVGFYLFAVRRHVFGDDAWKGWTLRYKETRT